MNRYQAGKDPVEAWGGETRGWVFPLLGNPRYRQRLETLAGVDLTRRAGCESCLRALVMDQWTPETLHHVGWCDSCRKASIALGKIPAGAGGAGAHRRRRAVLVALVAVAIAAPLAGSQLIGGGGDNRGGVAQQVPATTPSTTPGTTPTTTPGTTPTTTPGTTPATTPTTTEPTTTPTTTPAPTKPVVDPRPRSKPATHGAQALPHTT
jgi:hypothetical protein